MSIGEVEGLLVTPTRAEVYLTVVRGRLGAADWLGTRNFNIVKRFFPRPFRSWRSSTSRSLTRRGRGNGAAADHRRCAALSFFLHIAVTWHYGGGPLVHTRSDCVIQKSSQL